MARMYIIPGHAVVFVFISFFEYNKIVNVLTKTNNNDIIKGKETKGFPKNF